MGKGAIKPFNNLAVNGRVVDQCLGADTIHSRRDRGVEPILVSRQLQRHTMSFLPTRFYASLQQSTSLLES